LQVNPRQLIIWRKLLFMRIGPWLIVERRSGKVGVLRYHCLNPIPPQRLEWRTRQQACDYGRGCVHHEICRDKIQVTSRFPPGWQGFSKEFDALYKLTGPMVGSPDCRVDRVKLVFDEGPWEDVAE
jgi:hypothetical protein